MEDLYATVYVKTNFSKLELANHIADELRVRADSMGNIETDSLSISVRRQPDDDGPYFGKYNLLVEFEPTDQSTPANTIEALSSLLEGLWSKGMRTETSCDYENQLPHGGRFDGSTNKPIIYGGEEE